MFILELPTITFFVMFMYLRQVVRTKGLLVKVGLATLEKFSSFFGLFYLYSIVFVQLIFLVHVLRLLFQ